MKRVYLRLCRFVRQRLSAPDHKETQMRSNPTRAAILTLIEGRPTPHGTTAEEVRIGLQDDASPASVAYHLRVLADNGYVERDDAHTAPRFS